MSMFIASVATPLVVRLAKWLGAMDLPGARRIHTKATPRLGGLAVFIAFLGTVTAVWCLGNQVSNLLYENAFRLLVIMGGATIILGLGILDDMRGLRAKHKLLVEILVALALCSMGVRINALHCPVFSRLASGCGVGP